MRNPLPEQGRSYAGIAGRDVHTDTRIFASRQRPIMSNKIADLSVDQDQPQLMPCLPNSECIGHPHQVSQRAGAHFLHNIAPDAP
jgi:hypothetical protein